MKHLFTQVNVVDTSSPYHGETVNILIEADQIVAIGAEVTDAKAKIIEGNGACISPGWVELHSNFCDPGYEEREDLKSGAKAAARGGFTSVVLTPATNPVIQAKADIEYLLKKGDDTAINIYPLGALSRNLQGQELTEMYDMAQAGAVGFYDDKHAIKNPNLLKLAMLYTREFAPIMVHPRHPDLTEGGQMNEGPTSTYLGLKGIPAFAEELTIARDLFIAEYTARGLHFAGISTKGSVELIRQAKARGLAVTADVNFYNLILTETALKEYDTNFKVNPPLREQEDVDALLEGLKDGTIDAIAIDHVPQDVERKRCEFDLASFGMAAIESAFTALHPAIAQIGLATAIEKLTHGPRAVLNLPKIRIAEGSIAELTVFNPDALVNSTHAKPLSLAANNPFWGKPGKGGVLGIFNKSTWVQAV
jgi:dihydroorotase